MNQLELLLLKSQTDGAEPRLCIRTATRVDTGRWWRRSPLWLCVMANELISFAVGRRFHFERIPFAQCRRSHYHHAAGELVIDSDGAPDCRRFKISPGDALRVLNLLDSEKQQNTIELC